MVKQLQQRLSSFSVAEQTFGVFAAIVLACIFGGMASGSYWVLGIPAAVLIGYMAIVDFRTLFYVLICLIPISIEAQIGSFGTDLPTEPLILTLTGVYILYVLHRLPHTDTSFLLHPITLLLLCHLSWIVVSSITSSNAVVSWKFVAAKGWYVIVFYFLAAYLLKSWGAFRTLFWCITIPLFLTIVVTMIRHAGTDFAFSTINKACHPYYRNHVSYAAIMATIFPYCWLMTYRQKRWGLRWWLGVGMVLLLLVAIQLSYTRAAYGALLIAGGAYYVIRYRLTKWVLLLISIGAAAGIYTLQLRNNYLALAPNYNKAVTQENFDDLLMATLKGEDISTMERVYRWVAGSQMLKENPWVGFGPGNFYNFYKSYTLSNFRTYVSDNPEHSGIHNYFLMTLVEQGIIGLGMLVLFCFFVLLYGERVYHAALTPETRQMTMTVLLSTIIIYCILLINDMVETDKVGSFFFINFAILVNMDLLRKGKK